MKTFNKSNVLSVLSGAAFLLLQTFSATAQADYKGYWVDAVNAYQAVSYTHLDVYKRQLFNTSSAIYNTKYRLWKTCK